jgi:wobble nucleotide-excising tRNase
VTAILDRAEEIGKAINEIAKNISQEYWVKTGREIPVEDKMPEIVAAVIYVLDRQALTKGEE